MIIGAALADDASAGGADTDAPAAGRARPEPSALRRRVIGALKAAGTLVLPVVALAFVYLLGLLSYGVPFRLLDVYPPEQAFLNPGQWLTLGHLIVPAACFVICLTNRAYGPGVAHLQLFVTAALSALLLYAFESEPGFALLPDPLPGTRQIAFFLGAFAAAQIAAILVFDLKRGPVWWPAPFYALLAAGLTYALTYYPGQFWGTEGPWANRMVVLLSVHTAAAALLLIPYHVLRPAIRPRADFGGA